MRDYKAIAGFLQELKIFIVDDDDEDIILIQNGFDAIGFRGHIESFLSGKKMWETIRSPECTIPDLMIIDINLPGMNGYELMQRLNSHERFKDIPKIIVSTSNRDEDISKCKELNCLSYFQKPLTVEQFAKLARKMLEEYSDHTKSNTSTKNRSLYTNKAQNKNPAIEIARLCNLQRRNIYFRIL